MNCNEMEFVVAPDGNDGWPGDRAKPFRTLARARDAIRELKRTARLTGAVTVWLRGGRYPLAEPLLFTPEDSAPVTFAAWPGETPVIDGGEPLTGWQATTLNGKDAWVASVTGHFRSLFVNGRRALRPRLPKQGLYWVEDASAASAAPRTAGAPRRRATCPCAYSASGRWSPATAPSSWTPFPATSNGRAVRSSLPTGRSTRAGGEEHPAHWRSNVSPPPSAGGWSKQRAGKEEDND
jgi:hypothetical protein